MKSRKRIGFMKRKKVTLILLLRSVERILFGVALRKTGLFVIQLVSVAKFF